MEELLLTRVANENPAAMPIRDLFDDRPLATATPYERAIATLEASLADGPAFGPEGETLFELLRAPARHAPGSLSGQLRYIRERWRGLLGDALERLMGEIDLTLGILAEEERALHLRRGALGRRRRARPTRRRSRAPSTSPSASAATPPGCRASC